MGSAQPRPCAVIAHAAGRATTNAGARYMERVRAARSAAPTGIHCVVSKNQVVYQSTPECTARLSHPDSAERIDGRERGVDWTEAKSAKKNRKPHARQGTLSARRCGGIGATARSRAELATRSANGSCAFGERLPWRCRRRGTPVALIEDAWAAQRPVLTLSAAARCGCRASALSNPADIASWRRRR